MVEDTSKRHYEQETFWHFKCQCKICKDDIFDKRKHSLKCNNCKKIRPIDLKTWKIYKLDAQHIKEYELCDCSIPDGEEATEQCVKIYKYIWTKITKIQSSEKVLSFVSKKLYSSQRN